MLCYSGSRSKSNTSCSSMAREELDPSRSNPTRSYSVTRFIKLHEHYFLFSSKFSLQIFLQVMPLMPVLCIYILRYLCIPMPLHICAVFYHHHHPVLRAIWSFLLLLFLFKHSTYSFLLCFSIAFTPTIK